MFCLSCCVKHRARERRISMTTNINFHSREKSLLLVKRDSRVMQADSESISLRVYLQMFHALIFMIYRRRTKKFHKRSKLH